MLKKRVRRRNNMPMTNLSKDEAAVKLGEKITAMVKNGDVLSLKMHVRAFSSDNLFALAQAAGIAELEVGATLGS